MTQTWTRLSRHSLFWGYFQCGFLRTDNEKVGLLLRKVGPLEYDRYSNYTLPRHPRDCSFEETLETLKQNFCEHTSLFNARFNCLDITKCDTVDFTTFAYTVNKECERFKFSSITDEQFKYLIFVCRLRSASYRDVHTRILSRIEQNQDMTLQQVTEECRGLVNLKHDSDMVQQSVATTTSKTNTIQGRQYSTPAGSTQKKPPFTCWNSVGRHFARKCSFKAHRCRECTQQGHKEGFCTPSVHQTTNKRPYNKCRLKRKTQSLVATFLLNSKSNRKYVSVKLNSHPVRLQIDTASDITLISQRQWKTISQPPLTSSRHVARSASGECVHIVRELPAVIKIEDKTASGKVYVADLRHNLLGLDFIESLDLVDIPLHFICYAVSKSSIQSTITDQTEGILKRFKPVFTSNPGRCTQAEATLALKPSTKPDFRLKRPVPYVALPLVDRKLKRLEEMKVIPPVTYSQWAAPTVIVKKADDSIQLCVDFSTSLDAALEDHEYPLPIPEDIFSILNVGTCFAKLDLTEAYLQVEFSVASRELLTINKHCGLF